MTTVGIDVASSRRAVAIANEHGLWATAGLHPNSAGDWTDDAGAAIEELLQHERVVGVGETGLDFYRDEAPRDRQEDAFRAHIELAKRHDKALVIHTRESTGAALDVLEDEGPPQRLVFHCWSGAAADLQRALGLGAYISFAGNVSFKNADELRERCRAVPEDRLLVETDSPFLSPEPLRGKPNEPARVVAVGEALARARSVTVEELATATTRAAAALYGLAPVQRAAIGGRAR